MSYWLLSDNLIFPHPLSASPDGILAVGGDLSCERLLLAYQYGIYPWYNSGEPIIWWFTDPRCVLKPGEVHISRTMRRVIRRSTFSATLDRAFIDVVTKCRTAPREGQNGTWIHPEMEEAYTKMHKAGHAHSIEVWNASGVLVGGIYGIAIGKVFFGESMFSLVSNASKFALIQLSSFLQRESFTLIDCQQNTRHVRTMGATLMPAAEFHSQLSKNRLLPSGIGSWASIDIGLHL